MLTYNSNEKVKSGVPLGGIGTGKIEILPNGCLDYLTFMNNWRNPISNMENIKSEFARGLLGFHFGIAIYDGKKLIVKLLQTEKISGYDTIEKIKYKASYPKAELQYYDTELPIELKLTAFSTIIPHDYDASSTPGATFKFEATNNSDKKLDIIFFMIARNIIGRWFIGRDNKIVKDKNNTYLTFFQEKQYPDDSSFGEYSISVHGNGETIFYNKWNSQKVNFIYDREKLNLEFIDYLKKHFTDKKIEVKKKFEVRNENIQLASSIGKKFSLNKNQNTSISFNLGWFFPHKIYGHYYENKFSNSIEVCKYLDKNIDKNLTKIENWQKGIQNQNIPEWLKDALINNLYILTSSSWLTKDFKFSLYESPIICPLMGTIDVGFYATLPVAFLFPELEKSYLELFAKAQRKDGYIPHDLGFECFEIPSDGTTFYKWKDLNSKFILMLYRDYLWSNDKEYLKKLYPYAKKAFDWVVNKTLGKDSLPLNEGADQTFDTWNFFGVNSYTAGLYLAMLKAMSKISKKFNDKITQVKCDNLFKKASKNYEKLLWSGDYFYTANNNGKLYASCTVGQILGQWYAHLLNLDYLIDKNKIKSALKAIYRLNNNDSKYGCTNSVYGDGRRDMDFIHSRNYWPAIIYAYAAHCIYEDLENIGLEVAEKVWNTFVKKHKNPFNQPDCINPDTADYVFGDYYMRNMGIWGILFALAKKGRIAAFI